ncbi:MAG: hypothetical protein ACOY16_05935 [Chloroflexota bacterium]
MDIVVENEKEFVHEFLKEFLSDGLGAKTKREIDILVIYLLIKHTNLAEKSNHELSILLKVPESKIKRLLYEARLKYPPDNDYVQREFLHILAGSQFDVTKGKIVFVIEDEFLRHAIQGKLKSKGMFADSSFNTEIVRIDRYSLEVIIVELYGKEIAACFHDGFQEMENQAEGDDRGDSFKKTILKFVSETGKVLAIELLKSRLPI